MRSAFHLKLATALGLVCVLALSGCNIEKGSGVAVSEDRKVDDFNAITVSGSATVVVVVGPEKSVKVTCDDNLIQMLKTDVKGETLHVYSDGSYSTSIGMKVEVTVPALTEVTVSGSADVEAQNLSGAKFTAGLSGSGDIVASGEVDLLNLTVSGSADAKLKNLKAKKVSVSVSGSGDAFVFGSESVDAKAAGSGDIKIYGNPPKVEKSASGSADIDVVNE